MAKPNPRNANGARRRKLRQQVLATETHCGICGDEVDKTIATPHPDSPEVDEIVPVSRGGSPYQRSNCRLTHRRCNRTRGNRMPDDPQPGRTFVTTLRW